MLKRSKHCLFLRKLHDSLNTTYDELWSILLGEAIPHPCRIEALVNHFREIGWDVSFRDFLRGTAASNNPNFILLRLLRKSLSRSEIENMFFETRHNKRKSMKGVHYGEENL